MAITPKQKQLSQLEQFLPAAQNCKLFSSMTKEDISTLFNCFRLAIRSYQKGTLIFRAGDPQDSVGLVIAGEVQVQKEDYTGNRLILGIFSASDLFGEVSAYAGGNRWLNTVTALDDCQVVFIPTWHLSHPCDQLCFSHQSLIENMLSIVAGRALSMNQRIQYLKFKHIREKLAAYLYDQFLRAGSRTFMIPLNRESLADYLNVSRPSMSRELGRMKQEGIIDFYRQAFTIKDLAALKSLQR